MASSEGCRSCNVSKVRFHSNSIVSQLTFTTYRTHDKESRLKEYLDSVDDVPALTLEDEQAIYNVTSCS